MIVFWHLTLDFTILLEVYHHFFRCKGLGPSCYRGSSALHDDENDALLGDQAQMTDEERFKVGITVNIFPSVGDQGQNSTKFPNLILLNNENQITAYENTEEISFE